MYLCNHIHNLNRAKSSTVGFNLIKKVFSEEMLQHSHNMFMDTWWSGQICNLSNKDAFARKG